MIRDLSAQSSLVNRFVAELRDVEVQRDRARFRRNMERLGEIFAYEISKELPAETRVVRTPLGTSNVTAPNESPVLVTILRAGIPLHQGLLNYFDRADNGYIGAYRSHTTGSGFDIKLDYLSCAQLTGRTVIVADPMLATGRSLVAALEALLSRGKPARLHLVSIVAARPGIELIQKRFPEAVIWTAAIDPELNERAYIIPGLGDAGDLAFGPSDSH